MNRIDSPFRYARPVAALMALFVVLLLPMAVATAQATTATRSVEVPLRGGRLTDDDVRLLENETPALSLPATVDRVVYLVFESNESNLNDSLRHYAERDDRSLLSGSEDKFAPGSLIVAVGMDPRRVGVACGDDVCNAINFYGSGRMDGILDEMRVPLRQSGDPNIAAALLAGARAAGDTTVVSGDGGGDPTPWWIPAGVGGVGAAAGLGVAAWGLRRRRRQLRERYDHIVDNYARVASQLDSINVRAHSLSSPLADDTVRRDWEDVRSRFLAVDGTVQRLSGIGDEVGDRELARHRKEITEAYETVRQMENAEHNIDEFFRMEHGDDTVRRRHLTELHEDLVEARATVSDEGLRDDLDGIDARVVALRETPDAPDFMDAYARIITDYRIIIEAVRKREFDDVEPDDDNPAPRIWDASWHPGYGYSGFVPFVTVNSWHESATGTGAGSSGATTGYSSGGFSGGAASGSW
ncbi:DUF5129 domain-containing protein [Corynebacterium sp. TAE3-ERU16]|uniref:DUF5129 domain-containing protein n=1 Tax=Corynebacterium sp. TAE3-ERU16 TaxID=2849493 RepID=UPI001C47EE4E|nr:DUF5129 domain-containing protein [Corynebacterium sp. TAE3-ERU16]MBV7294221.1 DUF5129 domain-containing protein [Corynebacterium sp. TAE3-ERU16]